MRVILCLFDSLNRHALGAYGGTQVPTPNFDRLAARSTTFDNHWVGSLPCMPARRDFQTGRLSFLHRSWGPLEPFDPCLGDTLKAADVYSHLITDHYHYFEEGGANYHTKYHSWEFVRGQEGDPWKGEAVPPLDRFRQAFHPAQFSEKMGSYPLHYMVNRQHIRDEANFCMAHTFDLAKDFLTSNRAADRWFLQIETFDPHEPFHAPERLRKAHDRGWDGPVRDWPPYDRVTENAAEAAELRANYAASLAFCDEQLGRLLDLMDEQGMWDDTMLIVSTDHGYLLGEHDWWAKNRMPVWNEIGHIPLFVHHPAHPGGERRAALTQMIDLMPTVLDCFGLDAPDGVTGRSMLPLLADPDATHRAAAIFGYFGGAVNVTDGRHSYFRYPGNLADTDLFQYTLMPAHLSKPFTRAEFEGAELVHDLPFARGWPVLKLRVSADSPWYGLHGPAAFADTQTVLHDIADDPGQARPIDDDSAERRMLHLLCQALAEHGAPPELAGRLGL